MIRYFAALAMLLFAGPARAQITYQPPAGTTIGSYSANCVPKATSSTGLDCGLATDDGSNFTLPSGRFIIGAATAGGGVSLKRSGVQLQAVLGDDSAFAALNAANVVAGNAGINYHTGALTGTSLELGSALDTPLVYLTYDAANILAQRNGTAAQKFIVQGTYTDASNQQWGFIDQNVTTADGLTLGCTRAGSASFCSAINFNQNGSVIATFSNIDWSGISDQTTLGAGAALKSANINRSIQGSKSKAITDATATTFATIAVSSGGYEGGAIIGTVRCADATNHATGTVRVTFACDDTGGTTSCTFGTPDFAMQGDGTAAISTPTFDATDGSSLANLRINADCTGVTPTTLTFESRADIPTVATYTPQ